MARSLVQVDVPGGNIAQVVPWMNLDTQPWWELLRPLADIVGDRGVWWAEPIPDDVTDKAAVTGH